MAIRNFPLLIIVLFCLCLLNLGYPSFRVSKTEHKVELYEDHLRSGVLLCGYAKEKWGEFYQDEVFDAIVKLHQFLPLSVPIAFYSNVENPLSRIPDYVKLRRLYVLTDANFTAIPQDSPSTQMLTGALQRSALRHGFASVSGLVEGNFEVPKPGTVIGSDRNSSFNGSSVKTNSSTNPSSGPLLPSKLCKIQTLEASPFQTTLFLDTDAMLCRDVSHIFNVFEESNFSIALARDACKSSDLYDFNSGVILYKMTPDITDFLLLWKIYYLNNCVLPGYQNQDQCALWFALHKIKIDYIGVLSSNFNVRLSPDNWGQEEPMDRASWHSQAVIDYIYIYHTREYTIPRDDICDALNLNNEVPRVFGISVTSAKGFRKHLPLIYLNHTACMVGTGGRCNEVSLDISRLRLRHSFEIFGLLQATLNFGVDSIF